MECDNEIWTVFWYKNQINPDFIKNKKSKRIFEEKDSCVSLYKYVDKIQKYYIDRWFTTFSLPWNLRWNLELEPPQAIAPRAAKKKGKIEA